MTESTMTDKELFKSFKILFELFKDGVEKGIYPMFLPQDVMVGRIYLEFREIANNSGKGGVSVFIFSPTDAHPFESNLRARDKAMNIEDGLKNLGKIMYYAISGIWEYNDRSIKIDGYLPIKSICWPILKVLLLEENPSVKKVEAKIIEERAKIRDAAQFLDEVFEWRDAEWSRKMRNKQEGTVPWLGSPEWVWSYDPKNILISMNSSILDGIDRAGFIHKISLEKVAFDYEKAINNRGLEKLKLLLENKNIESIEDKIVDKWYLKIVYK